MTLRLTNLLLFVTATLAIVGCGQGGSSTTTTSSRPPSTSPSPPVTDADGEAAAPADSGRAAAPAAGGWGDLTGRFVYDGTAPETAQLTISKDVEFCTKKPPVDETVVVNKDDGGLANVVIWLYQKSGSDPVDVHESYEATANEKVTLDNQWCRFNGHVVPLRTSQTLLIRNLDEVGHNTKIDTLNNPPINPILPAGGELEQQFAEAERLPASASCNIHPWMKAWLLIKDNPYMAVTDENGKFEIKNLPTGAWTFQVWHEKPGYITDVNKGGAATKWSKGRFEMAVNPGSNDLGEIKISPDVFE